MTSFENRMNSAMKAKGLSIRGLEQAVAKRERGRAKISRGLLGDYVVGKRAPSYTNAVVLADVLDIPREEFLVETFKLKQKLRQDAEKARFQDFLTKRKIMIDDKRF